MAERDPLGDFLASLPYQIGYQLDDQHVAAAAFAADGSIGPIAAIRWDTTRSSDRDLAEGVAATLARVARQSHHEQFLLVGYGPHGADRAQLLADALLATADLPDPVCLHVQADTWRVQVTGSHRWSPARPLPDLAAETVLAGTPTPARTRDELAARFDPLPDPRFGSIPAHDAAVFANSSPSFRAEAARRTLSQLATPGHGDDPGRMAVLAHLVDTGPAAVRDTIILAAADDPARADALTRTYQAAPASVRPALATASATAVYLRGGPTAVLDRLLRHADRDGVNARLTGLVEAARTQAIDPRQVRRGLDTAIAQSLADADRQWEQDRSASVRSASFPGPVHTPGTQPEPGVPPAGSDHPRLPGRRVPGAEPER